jgi:hypothetical protein
MEGNENDLSKRHFLKFVYSVGVLLPSISFWRLSADFQIYIQKLSHSLIMRRVPLRAPTAFLRREDGTNFIYMESHNTKLKINESAELIWRLCDGKHRNRDIAAIVSLKFDVPLSQCLRDVASSINIFRTYGVIKI